MKKLIYSAAFALLAAMPAQAADVAVEMPDWTGFYVGIGAAQNTTTNVVDSYIINGVSDRGPTAEDFAGFGYAGYRMQMNNIVLGLEGEFDIGGKATFGTVGGSVACVPVGGRCADAGTFGTFDQQGRARAIAGYAVDPKFMVYVAGGLSVGQANFEGIWGSAADGLSSITNTNTPAPTAKTMYGYNIGAGAELKVTDRVSLRGEVIYDNYGNMDVSPVFFGIGAGVSSASISSDSSGYDSLSARTSISFNF